MTKTDTVPNKHFMVQPFIDAYIFYRYYPNMFFFLLESQII